MSARISAGLVSLVVVALLTACTGATPQPTGSSAPPPTAAAASAFVAPIIVSAIGDPLVVAGSDGMQHIDYDLLVTNVFTAPVTLTSVAVRDQATGTPVFTLAGDGLAAVTESNFLQQPVTPPAEIPVSGQVSVQVDVKLPAKAALPATLDHVLQWSVPATAPALAFLDGKATGQVTALPIPVSTIPAVEIRSPLKGSGWWALSGCCQPNPHRSLRYAIDGTHEVKAEMFAVDWVRLTDGAFFTGDGSANSDFTYINSDVLAVADGTVVIARDDLPDETPFQAPANVKKGVDYTGNSVVIQIAPDRYAIYAHLELGSVAVKVGDKVTAGQRIAGLGNSGNSTAAHLHFVVTDNPDFLVATSIPFVIGTWSLQGTAAAPDAPGEIPIVGTPTPQMGTHPLWESVSDFG